MKKIICELGSFDVFEENIGALLKKDEISEEDMHALKERKAVLEDVDDEYLKVDGLPSYRIQSKLGLWSISFAQGMEMYLFFDHFLSLYLSEGSSSEIKKEAETYLNALIGLWYMVGSLGKFDYQVYSEISKAVESFSERNTEELKQFLKKND